MKKTFLTFVVLVMSFWSSPLFSQVENEVVALGLPGDNLNLYAVLDIFQKSQTIEEFERNLNSKDSNINNLDLNNDNFVDYISVVSYNLGHFYSIVLRVSINSNEYQDVAVIEVSKNNAGNTIVQIIGDEALYGKDYVVEPSVREAFETPNPGYIGDRTIIVNNNVYGNGIIYVADWPIIAYIFSPSFSLYVSPWHWGYYPVYWSPWRPILYYNYWNYHNHYYRSPLYQRTSYIRFPSNHSYYLKRRTTSRTVNRNRNAGTYRSTYGGRDFRKPVAPPKVPTSTIRRENRETTRQRVQPSTRSQENPSIRQENRENTRQRVQPSVKPQEKTETREENRETTRQRVQPATRPQEQSGTRQENRESTRQRVQPSTRSQGNTSSTQQARPSINRSVPSSVRQTGRQVRQAARQTAKEERRSNRSESQQKSP
jgi:hypothetical protein